MDLNAFLEEEDLFPREFASMTLRPWGCLFHNDHNRDSYDSNHALLLRSQVTDLPATLREISSFYLTRGLHPCIYQSIRESGWFGEIAGELDAAGYRSWQEEHRFMALTAPSVIVPAPDLVVRQESIWRESMADFFAAAGEPWEIPVVRRQMENPGTLCFTAGPEDALQGLIFGHMNWQRIFRVDYLLVTPAARHHGVGSALTHRLVQHLNRGGIPCVLWPDGDIPERIYRAAGFRPVETRLAGRASWRGDQPLR